MVKIKICGVRDEAGARACAAAGVDLVGLNFVAGRKRAITAERAKALAPLTQAQTVGVFLDAAEVEIRRVATQVELQWVQLHGRETPELCRALSGDFEVIKAISVTDDFRPEVLEQYTPYVAAFLFDAKNAGGGKTFDWDRIRSIRRERPIFLAGGLDSNNVAQAIERVRPEYVDTASGVELDGVQDPARIQAFVHAVRAS